jgi:chromatin licensing and DNA replication factor 1
MHSYFLTIRTFSLKENGPVFFTDRDKINLADPVGVQEKMASLRSTFGIVCDISHSIKNSLITKQELFHNILANNLEIEQMGNDDHYNNSNLYLLFCEQC